VRLVACLLALCFAARGARAAERIVFYDPDYSVQYGGDPMPALAYFKAHGYQHFTTQQLIDWIGQAEKDGRCRGSAVVHLSDITPKELVEPWDQNSALYRFCAAGGRWVAPAGNTLYSFEGRDEFTITNQSSYTPEHQRYLTAMFRAKRVYALRGKGQELTDLGRAWGLEHGAERWMKRLTCGVPPEDVQPLVLSEDGKAALIWVCNVNRDCPWSGLVGLCVYLRNEEPLLDMIYRLCVYAGEPVATVPRVDWRPKEEVPAHGVRLSATVGDIPRRAFQRGETIPLRIEAFGTAYRGEPVRVSVMTNGTPHWQLTVPSGERRGLTRVVRVPTEHLRCGAYTVRLEVPGRAVAEETFDICPARRHTTMPWFVCKMHRKNPKREEVALRYLRDHNLNAMIFDLYQLENAPQRPADARRLGHYLDLLLKLNMNASARPNALAVFADRDEDALILYDGKPLKHGVKTAMGWRGFVENHLDRYRNSLRRQAVVLRDTRSPVIVPWFTTNDDGSMGGNFDFHETTMRHLTRDTGLTREQLPRLKKMPDGNSVFMPEVAPGVVADAHPWLRYFRWHCGQYRAISTAAVEGLGSGWPGCYVQDTGCMAGPLYMPRAYYPPLTVVPLNTAGFYQYLFWFHAYPFGIEAARMGNRDKPVGVLLSASWIDWGAVFQRGMIYRTLAEAPAAMGFWSLDARRQERWDTEEESWTEMQRIGEQLRPIAPYITRQRAKPRQGALFFGLAQNCFKLTDRHLRPDYMRAALENFQRAGFKLDLLSTEEVMAGRHEDYRALFVTGHQWITKGAKERLEDFAANGGGLVVDSETTVSIEGARRVDGPFATGLRDVSDAACVSRCRAAAQPFLTDEDMMPVSPQTIVRVNRVDEHSPLAWVIDVETMEELHALHGAHSTDWSNGTRLLLNKWEAAGPMVRKTVRVRRAYWAYDLYAQQELPMRERDKEWQETELAVEAFGARPVALLRDRIASLEALRFTPRVRLGESAAGVFQLAARSGTAVRDPAPAMVTVVGPNGRELWEYGGPCVIEHGLLSVVVPVAVNDLPGAWHVTVRELCSGRETKAPFTVDR